MSTTTAPHTSPTTTPPSRRAPPFQKGQSGNPAGGKRKQLPKHGLQLIIELASRGVRRDTIGRACGMSAPTFARLMQDDPAVTEAYETGRAKLHDELVGVLVDKAKDGDTVSLLFALKGIFHLRDSGPEPGTEVRSPVIINLPGALPLEAFHGLTIEQAGERVTLPHKAVQRG